MRSFLLLVLISLVNSKKTHSSTIRVFPGTDKCFSNIMRAGETREVNYAVKNSGANIDFWLHNPGERYQVKQLRRNSGRHKIHSKIMGDYSFCFENYRGSETVHVDFNVTFKNMDDKNFHSFRSWSFQYIIQSGVSTIVHERSMISVLFCGAKNIDCTEAELKQYNWFMDTFPNLLSEDKEDLEAIYKKYAHHLTSLDTLIDTKDTIASVKRVSQNSYSEDDIKRFSLDIHTVVKESVYSFRIRLFVKFIAVCFHLYFKNRKQKEDTNAAEKVICAICIELLNDEAEVLDCSHKYHHTCVSKWVRQNPVCPVCRADVILEHL